MARNSISGGAYKLTVTLVKALDLPASDYGFLGLTQGKSDPYVKFKVGAHVEKSSRIDKDLNPTWTPPETFTFDIDDPRARVLEVEVYDYDRFNNDDFLGRVNLPIFPFLEAATSATTKPGGPPRGGVRSYNLEVPSEFDKQRRKSVIFLDIALHSTRPQGGLVLELWENEFYHIRDKWVPRPLQPGDRLRWSAVDDSTRSSESFDAVAPRPPAGVPPGSWQLDVSQGDDHAWCYATSFQGPWEDHPSTVHVVRRRKWIMVCGSSNDGSGAPSSRTTNAA